MMDAASEDPDVLWQSTSRVFLAAEDVGDDIAGVEAACDVFRHRRN